MNTTKDSFRTTLATPRAAQHHVDCMHIKSMIFRAILDSWRAPEGMMGKGHSAEPSGILQLTPPLSARSGVVIGRASMIVEA